MAPRKPMAVLKAEEETQRIQESLAKGEDPMAPKEGKTEETPAPEPKAPPETPPGLPPLAAVETPETPETPAEPQPPAQKPSEVDGLREELRKVTHSLSVLEGKYNAEVPRLHEQNRQLQAENEKLKASPQTQQQPQQQGDLSDEAKEAVAAIKETYGDKLADQFLAIAKGVTPQAPQVDLSKYDQTIDELKTNLSTIQESQSKSAEDQYFDWLDKNIPNWQKINVDPKFHEYLNGVAPYSGGKTYGQILVDSHGARKGTVVKEIFDSFTSQYKPEAPAQPGHQQIPDTTPSSPQNQQNSAAGRMWTESEVNAVYNARISGDINDEQFAAYEAEIHKAGLEGRIVAGQ